MSLFEFVCLLVIAGICGGIGQSIAGGSRSGCIASIALGFVGALLGNFLARQLRLPEWLTFDVGGRHFPIVWSIIGSTLFVAVVTFFTRGRRA
jgi:uncharacterized membrane protein YeaQ/YmgE (transglycosylase-associated protein family)